MRRFGSDRITADDATIRSEWDRYLQTLPDKMALIAQLPSADANRLLELLAIETKSIRVDEQTEMDLIADLESMSHQTMIRRIHRLEQCFAYVETKAEYAFKLLEELEAVLRTQIELAQHYLRSGNPELIHHLQRQADIEQRIVDKISAGWRDFGVMLSALLRGEQHVTRLHQREQDLVQRLYNGIIKRVDLGTDAPDQGIVFAWQQAILDELDNRIADMVARRVLGAHPYVDLEFVNRPEFVQLARESIRRLRTTTPFTPARMPKDRTINAFVEIFRNWYNFEMRHPAD